MPVRCFDHRGIAMANREKRQSQARRGLWPTLLRQKQEPCQRGEHERQPRVSPLRERQRGHHQSANRQREACPERHRGERKPCATPRQVREQRRGGERPAQQERAVKQRAELREAAGWDDEPQAQKAEGHGQERELVIRGDLQGGRRQKRCHPDRGRGHDVRPQARHQWIARARASLQQGRRQQRDADQRGQRPQQRQIRRRLGPHAQQDDRSQRERMQRVGAPTTRPKRHRQRESHERRARGRWFVGEGPGEAAVQQRHWQRAKNAGPARRQPQRQAFELRPQLRAEQRERREPQREVEQAEREQVAQAAVAKRILQVGRERGALAQRQCPHDLAPIAGWQRGDQAPCAGAQPRQPLKGPARVPQCEDARAIGQAAHPRDAPRREPRRAVDDARIEEVHRGFEIHRRKPHEVALEHLGRPAPRADQHAALQRQRRGSTKFSPHVELD